MAPQVWILRVSGFARVTGLYAPPGEAAAAAAAAAPAHVPRGARADGVLRGRAALRRADLPKLAPQGLTL